MVVTKYVLFSAFYIVYEGMQDCECTVTLVIDKYQKPQGLF